MFFLFGSFVCIYGQGSYKYRLYLKDKDVTHFSIDNPQEYLSEKAIDRRIRQNIPIDETDLPVSHEYIRQIESLGCAVVAKSKWLNTVTVQLYDISVLEDLETLAFVENMALVWERREYPKKAKETESPAIRQGGNIADEYYGSSFEQINLHNGQYLHRAGYKGEGMEAILYLSTMNA